MRMKPFWDQIAAAKTDQERMEISRQAMRYHCLWMRKYWPDAPNKTFWANSHTIRKKRAGPRKGMVGWPRPKVHPIDRRVWTYRK